MNSKPNPRLNPIELKAQADRIRKDVVEVSVRNGAGHIAPSLSSVDYLIALYYHSLNHTGDPLDPKRDRLILSKAHGGYALYSILSDLGYIARADWDGFYKNSFLAGCAEMSLKHGLEAGCGSLGHGLPMAAGMAYGLKVQGIQARVYCVVGDGEMQEGSNWEAVQFAAKFKLDNLVIVIDNNGLQAMDFLQNVLTDRDVTEDLHHKFEAFGTHVERVDGHHIEALVEIFERWKRGGMDRPQVMLAKCIKGYGVKAMENVAKFHFRLPTEEDMAQGVRYE